MKEERKSKREGVTHGLSKYLHALGACTASSKTILFFQQQLQLQLHMTTHS